MENRKLSSLDEVEADLIINCSGLGAAELVSDSNLFPVSGHVLRVTCGHVGHTMADNRPESWSYIIPNSDSTVVLGSVDKEVCVGAFLRNLNEEKIRIIGTRVLILKKQLRYSRDVRDFNLE